MRNIMLSAALLMGLAPLGASAEAVPTTAPTPGGGETLSIAALFEQAEAHIVQNEYAAALALYQQALAQLPVSPKAQQAAYKAGICLAALYRPAEAIGMYDRTVELGIEVLRPEYYRTQPDQVRTKGGKRSSIEDRIESALYAKAVMCQLLGDATRGLKAIAQLRVTAPNSRFITKMVPLQLEFESRPADLSAGLIQQEQLASELGTQAHEAFWARQYEEALPLLDRVLTEYPGTAAVLRAKVDKARILWIRKEYDASRALWEQVLAETGHIAPDADYTRMARYHIAWRDLSQLVKPSQAQARRGQAVSGETWKRIRDACRVIMELDPDPFKRAEANVALIEAYSWEGRYDDVLSAASQFFRNFRGSRSGKERLPRELSWARLFVGDALEHLGRPEEAAMHYRAILEAASEHPELLADDKVVERANVRLAQLSSEEP